MDESLQRILADLQELTAIDGVSGHEEAVVAHLKAKLEPIAESVEIDRMGNIYARVHATRSGATLMVAAHTDEIGCIVKSIDPRGLIRFDKVGGVLDALLPGRAVRINGRVPGVVGVRSGHFSRAEAPAPTNVRDLYIDIGAASADEVVALGVRIGDPIAVVSPLQRIGPHYVSGKAVDDRIGCAALLELVRRARAGALRAGTLVAAFTVQEEVGLRGAAIAAYRVHPDLAIALDTAPAGDQPDMDLYRDLPARAGGGPLLQLATGGANGRGFFIYPGMRRLLLGLAEEIGIPYQTTIITASNTDATSMQMAREGVPSGIISFARRYSHTPVEMLDLRDARHALTLLEALVGRLGELPSLEFLG